MEILAQAPAVWDESYTALIVMSFTGLAVFVGWIALNQHKQAGKLIGIESNTDARLDVISMQMTQALSDIKSIKDSQIENNRLINNRLDVFLKTEIDELKSLRRSK